jgi:hypothetical protein
LRELIRINDSVLISAVAQHTRRRNAVGERWAPVKQTSQRNEFGYVKPYAASAASQSQQERWKEREGSIEGREFGEA